jgi:tetratricopeptide (TPR) repeat protein
MRASPFFPVLMGDAHGYDDWAQRIAGGDWIGHEVFYQAPLYPYLLGVIYAIGGRSLLVVRIIQAIVGSASCALLALAASRLFSRPVGIAAGAMLALYAPAIFFDGLLQKSVLDVFFICLALWLMSKTMTAEDAEPTEKQSSSRSPRSRRLNVWLWLGLGLAMGGLALTRENALVFIVVLLAWAIVAPANQRRFGAQAARAAASFLLGVAIVVLPVAIRNSLVGGGFYITTSQFGPNFYIGNNPAADGTYQSLRYGRGAPEYERQDATELAQLALGRRLAPAEVSSYWTDRALDFITSRPAAWLRLMGRKVALLWNATEMLDTESQEAHADWSWPLRIGAVIGHFGVLVPLALFGVFVTWPMRSRLWILYAMTLAYAASVVLFYVFARYRYPLVPFLIMFAAAGVAALPELVRARSIPGGLWTLAAVAVVALFANRPILSTTLMRAVTELNLGAALQGDGRLDEAQGHYERAITLSHDYAPAYNNLATVLRAKGRLGEAEATYERALRLRPEYPEAHYNLANVLLDEGKPGEAIDHFRQALQTIAASADVHNNLGIALAGQGKHEEAIAEFRAALQVDPDSVKARRNLGDALASARRFEEAIDQFRLAAQLDPSDGSAHYDLGSLLLELGRLDEAIAEFRAALKVNPGSVEAHNNLGIALGSQGKLDDAIEQFRRALQIQPDLADAQRNLATALDARRRGR